MKKLILVILFITLLSPNVFASDVIETLDLDEIVKISEYILRVEKISSNRYKVTGFLFGVISKDGPKTGKEINIVDDPRYKKSNDPLLRVSRLYARYLPDYMKLINTQLQEARQNAMDFEDKIMNIGLAHSEIFQSIDTKILSDDRVMKLMGATLKKIPSLRQESIKLREYLGSLGSKIQELRKDSTLKIVFLKKLNGKDYYLTAIDGFELSSLEDKVKTAISKRVNSGNSGTKQGKTYRYQR